MLKYLVYYQAYWVEVARLQDQPVSTWVWLPNNLPRKKTVMQM